jgi:quinoprotein glucose dehydrogenase
MSFHHLIPEISLLPSPPMLKASLFPALFRGVCSIVVIACSFAAQAVELGEKKTSSGIDPELAIKQFKAPAPFKIDLFAAEPQLMNPVAFCFDEQGRVYVAETFRYRSSVYDIREHMNMFDDDLAARTVEDRAAMIKKFLGDKTGDLAVESEVVRLVEDRDGDGKADVSTVFADGFNSILDGIGSGVLARKGKVWFTDIPNLWLLQDTNHDGKADVRTSLSYGYGVHFNLTGHDLHGLRMGPDGKLYYSIGDRGIHVTTKEGKLLDFPDMGTVLRCNPDGTELEVFAYGVRNPQELAFDDHGNLFTGDNNCDHGDAARLVYLVEGGDSGWRTGNQFSETTPAGVWNAEKLWHLQFPGQAAYVLPPVAHIADGPSGLAHYPGTGFAAAWKDHFFLCDFRGASANSGVHSFAVEPKGATFTMIDHTHFLWNILATDVDFSPDGRMFVSDWVQGWPQSQKGRLYRLYDPELVKKPVVAETKKLLAEGMEKRSLTELAALLAHADQRVRQEAQFELADRGPAAVSTLEQIALNSKSQLARLHAIWGLGQISAKSKSDLSHLAPLLHDADAEVRGQVAKQFGDHHYSGADNELIRLLKDTSPRVQFFAAASLGKLKNPAAVAPILEMLRANADEDVYVRHAGMMALIGCADKAALLNAAKDKSASVRMGVLLAMRRLQLPDIALFLHDAEPLLVLEAARAISDVPIAGALPQLAALIDHPTPSEPLDWRVINANFRLGTDQNATALAAYAAQSGATEKVRGEALHALGTWAKPSQRDRLTGLWRPLDKRDGKVAATALRPVIAKVLSSSPKEVQLAAIQAAKSLALEESGTGLFALVTDTKAATEVRVEALKALDALHDARLLEAVNVAVADRDETVRKEGNRLQAQVTPGDATVALAVVLKKGSLTEKQGALATLGTLKGEAADKLLAAWLDQLIGGKVPKEFQFDLVEAVNQRDSALVKDKLKKYLAAQPKDDEFAGYREVLYGGDAEVGRKIFLERPEAACTRCHKIKGEGGEVGPELTGIMTRHDRQYILESILYPNKQIAAGFESVLVTLKNGQVYAGILKSEDANELVINSPEDGILKVKKVEIESRQKGLSPMPEGIGTILSKQDIRNLVEFLATLK